jgi:hypothetical protein
MRRALAAIAVAFLVTAALTACGDGPPSGVITEMEHDAAHSTRSCSGKPSKCRTIRHTECWEIEYRADDGREGERCGSEEAWQSSRVGARVPR